ncbi:MAG: hypothetical protein ACYDC1_24165 [Limisphaerales bacterium]
MSTKTPKNKAQSAAFRQVIFRGTSETEEWMERFSTRPELNQSEIFRQALLLGLPVVLKRIFPGATPFDRAQTHRSAPNPDSAATGSSSIPQ